MGAFEKRKISISAMHVVQSIFIILSYLGFHSLSVWELNCSIAVQYWNVSGTLYNKKGE
jgi:hypothetical protein